MTWTYHRPLLASASSGAPPGVGERGGDPDSPNQARANLRGAPRNPPHLSIPPSPVQLGRGRARPLALLRPHRAPVPAGAAPVAVARDPPSPCRGAARTRASSRWRRSGRARGVHRAAVGRGRAGAAPGRAVQPGRGPAVIINPGRLRPAPSASAPFQQFPPCPCYEELGVRMQAPRQTSAFEPCRATYHL